MLLASLLFLFLLAPNGRVDPEPEEGKGRTNLGKRFSDPEILFWAVWRNVLTDYGLNE